MQISFADRTFDTDTRELRCSGAVVAVEPQVFDVLAHLIRHRDRVVPKTELLDEIWGDRFVSESALTSRIKSARRAVGDTGRDQRVIRTVHGHGFRFVAPVDVDPPAAETALTDPGPSGELGVRVLGLLAAGSGRSIEVIGGDAATAGRLADDAYEQAAAAGHLVGRGSGAGAGLRAFGCVLDGVEEIVHRSPELIDRLPTGCRDELTAVLTGQGASTRTRLFLTVREVLVAAAGTTTTLLVLDELECADPETLALLRQVVRVTRHHPVVVVAAHAPGVDLEDLDEHIVLEHPGDDARPAASRIPPELVEVLRGVALEGSSFDLVGFRAAAGDHPDAADRLLDTTLAVGLAETLPGLGGFRFTVPGLADELVADLPPHHRVRLHRMIADRLAELDADPARVAGHLLAAQEPRQALPRALEAAERAAAMQAYPEVLRWTGAVLDGATGDDRRRLLTLRAGALADTGDPTAVQVYREALAAGPPADEAVLLRAGLARAAVLGGDLRTAEEALAAIGPEHDETGPVALVRALVCYFSGDLEGAEALLVGARNAALAGGASVRFIDVIALQGLIAHSRGEWFDRLRRELRTTRDRPELALSVFDGHLCVAEYLLYGPTPYAEVVALAEDLRANAERSGARRAVAFATCMAGEAKLLAGDVDGARADLAHALDLHRELGADAGTAHSLQRLAEAELAGGDPVAATRLLREAVPIGRWSPVAQHILQRIYGTLIAAAPDTASALAVVDEAAEVLDGVSACEVCQVMIEIPATVACAAAGRVDEARAHLERAERSAAFWEGTAWPGAVAEATAAIARAEGRDEQADGLLADGADLFERAGQPLDAARCREAIGG